MAMRDDWTPAESLSECRQGRPRCTTEAPQAAVQPYNYTVRMLPEPLGCNASTPAGMKCTWPHDFQHLRCCKPASLPLWRMLSGQLPGFVSHDTLLLAVLVKALPNCTDAARDGGCAEPPVGPKPRTLSTPLLSMGYLEAAPPLWRTHGVSSPRLAQASGSAMQSVLNQTRRRLFAPVPDAEAALQRAAEALGDAAAASWAESSYWNGLVSSLQAAWAAVAMLSVGIPAALSGGWGRGWRLPRRHVRLAPSCAA